MWNSTLLFLLEKQIYTPLQTWRFEKVFHLKVKKKRPQSLRTTSSLLVNPNNFHNYLSQTSGLIYSFDRHYLKADKKKQRLFANWEANVYWEKKYCQTLTLLLVEIFWSPTYIKYLSMGNFRQQKQLNHVSTKCMKTPKRFIQLVSRWAN